MIATKITLTTASLLISLASVAFPCSKYVLDFGTEAFHGDVTITWSINTGFSRCGFEKEEAFKHRFIVTIKNIFDDVFIIDTVDSPVYRMKTKQMEGGLIIATISELDDTDVRYNFHIKPRQISLPMMASKIDSLNIYLLNGCFVNALSILSDINRKELIPTIKIERDILFPDHFPTEETYFNWYIDKEKNNLIRIPYVDGLSSFIKEINKLTKNNPKRSYGFSVYATISGDSTIKDYEVIPSSDKKLFEKVSHLLTFTNHRQEDTEVLLKFGRSKNRRKFTVVNERALIDQNSKSFKINYRYRGALH